MQTVASAFALHGLNAKKFCLTTRKEADRINNEIQTATNLNSRLITFIIQSFKEL
jgi:hypothetical protein